MELGLSYDDVLLIPQRSPIKSRKDVSTETFLTKNIKLKIPIVSSNMDTVTEADMAIALADLGGIGIIHRFNTTMQQVKEVEKVKRHRNAIIENPLWTTPEKTLAEAKEIMKKHDVTSLLVLDDSKRLIGILTSRDYWFDPSENIPIYKLMTPKKRLIVAKNRIQIEKAKQIMMKHKIEKLPLINDDWTVAGLVTGRDIHNKTRFPNSTLDSKHSLRVGAAIGVKEDALDRAKALIKAGADLLVIDIAHGHSDIEIEVLKRLKSSFPKTEVMAGNVATADGTRDLIKAGADCVKVGVGPGSICTTRIVTGAGYPQLSAILSCAKEGAKYGIPIIADGGIKQSGDITKAIAAGASSVMLGSLLAGTDESPGTPILKNGGKYKVVRGMASFGAKLGRDAKSKSDSDISDFVPEGVEATVPYRGSVIDIINQLVGGFRSGMSYCGARTIKDLKGRGEFIQITQAGVRESKSHDVNVA
ncbi:MAG: IMP dehydrogenase [archaeon]